MKVKRCKHAKRIIHFYKNNFGFREPLQVLVDGTFCQAASKGKVNIKEQLPKYLCCTVQVVATKCVLAELASHPVLRKANFIAKNFKIHNCFHSKALPPVDCFDSFIGPANSKHYCVATQDSDMHKKFEERGGTPLLHIIRNTIVLESPTEISKQKVAEISLEKILPTLPEHVKKNLKPFQHSDVKLRRKRPQGPNPLSVKKKKQCNNQSEVSYSSLKLQRNKVRRLRLMRRTAIEQLAKKL